jgi:hypothetical protein
MEKVGKLTAIKRFFESGDDGRKVTMEELKVLTMKDREDLAGPCAKAMGLELKEN